MAMETRSKCFPYHVSLNSLLQQRHLRLCAPFYLCLVLFSRLLRLGLHSSFPVLGLLDASIFSAFRISHGSCILSILGFTFSTPLKMPNVGSTTRTLSSHSLELVSVTATTMACFTIANSRMPIHLAHRYAYSALHCGIAAANAPLHQLRHRYYYWYY